MKKIFNLLLAMLTVCNIACTPEQNEAEGDNTTKFTIGVTDITSTSAVMNVEASDISAYLIFDIVSQDRYDTYATPAEFAKSRIEKVKSKANAEGIAFVDALSVGAGSLECTELKGGVNYYAYAFGLTSEGTPTTGVTLEPFTTEPWASDNTFTLEVTSTSVDGAVINANATNSTDTFFCNFVEQQRYDEYDGENIACLLLEELKERCANDGYSFTSELSKGKVKRSCAGLLTPDTEYYAFAFGASKSGEVTTDITITPFKTISVEEASAGIDNGDTNIENLVSGMYKNLGDYFDIGAAYWNIMMSDASGRGSLYVQILSNLSETELPLGEYPISSSLEAGIAIAGNLDANRYYTEYGTRWILYSASWAVDELVFMKSGTVTIGKSGDDYTININAIDGHGNTVTMSYTGALEKISD